MNNNRVAYLDIAKFLGIACVVIGHISSPVEANVMFDAIHNFVYQFHIPLFFFLSGIFYRKRESFFVFLKSKTKRLYIPYIASNSVFLVITLLLRSSFGYDIVLLDNIKHLVKIAIGLAVTDLGGGTWFLFILFVALNCYDLLGRTCGKINMEWLQTILVLSLAGITAFVTIPLGYGKVFAAMLYIHAGRLYNDYRHRLSSSITSTWKTAYSLFIPFLSYRY